MRTGGRFRMVLDAEHAEINVAQPFNRVVVEVDVGDFRAGKVAIGCGRN